MEQHTTDNNNIRWKISIQLTSVGLSHTRPIMCIHMEWLYTSPKLELTHLHYALHYHSVFNVDQKIVTL